MSKHFFFIINPNSEKKSSELKKIIINFFKDLDERCTIFISKNFKHIGELAIKAIEFKANTVIACGGDGTVNMVGQVLVGTDIQLGIIPIGSGNGVANNININNNYQEALRKIISGNSLKIDVGRIDNYYFFSNVGFGLEAEFIRHYKLRNSHGFLSYFISFFKSLNSYKPSKFQVEINNSSKEKIIPYMLMVVNTNEQGYGISVSPEARIDDGFLNYISISKTNLVTIVYYVLRILLGLSIKSERISKFEEIKSVKVISKNKYISLQIDGEYLFLPKNSTKISVIPKALNILC